MAAWPHGRMALPGIAIAFAFFTDAKSATFRGLIEISGAYALERYECGHNRTKLIIFRVYLCPILQNVTIFLPNKGI